MIEVLKKLPFGFILEESKPVVQAQPRKVKASKQKPQVKKSNYPVYNLGLSVHPFDENRYDQAFYIYSEWFISVAERILMLATSRMGKSNLAGLLLEQYLDQKGIACFIDPQDEWWTLQDKYNCIVVGGNIAAKKKHYLSDETISEQKRKLRIKQLENRIPLTYKESDYTPHKGMEKEEKQYLYEKRERDLSELKNTISLLVEGMLTKGFSLIFALTYQTALSDKQFITKLVIESLREHNNVKKRKMKLVFEEAHEVAPQSGGSICLSDVEGILKQGGKEGIDCIVITQSIASLSKQIANQCNIVFAGGVRMPRDVAAVEAIFGKNGPVTAEDIRNLQQKHFYYLYDGKAIKFKSFKRKCESGGSTPEFKANAPLASNDDIEGFIKNLKGAR